MTFTYNLAELGTSSLMQARLEIGDTDENDQKLQDEEIARLAAVERDFWGTCAHCCEIIARGLLMKADVRLGRNLYLIQTKAAAQYLQMAKELRKKSLGTQVPWVGGMTLSDKQDYDQDESLVQPAFTRNMMADPFVGGLSSDTDDTGLPLGSQ